MAITLANADNALKTVYLDAVSEQLNYNASPFLAQIEKTSENIWGKEVRKLVIHGINGGIGAGTEDGDLPKATGNQYAELKATLKNLYGVIEISDKALKASENNAGAFVSLLNAEMDGLIKASRFNFGRILFGDGSGTLARVNFVSENKIAVDSVKNFEVGMIVEVRDGLGKLVDGCSGKTVVDIDTVGVAIQLSDCDEASLENVRTNYTINLQGSYKNEITGLGSLFGNNRYSIHGLVYGDNPWLEPYIISDAGEVSEDMIQRVLDKIEERASGNINFMVCSYGVRRKLQQLFAQNHSYVGTMEIKGGYKAMSYNGIPIVADRFCPEGCMYMLNTDDFALHQLCDWQWLTGDDGKVLRQIPGKPIYTATMVKYAELICSRPFAQGAITGIMEE